MACLSFHSGHLALVAALAFAHSLVDGRRVQPIIGIGRDLQADVHTSAGDSPISDQSEKRYSYNESVLDRPESEAVGDSGSATSTAAPPASATSVAAPSASALGPVGAKPHQGTAVQQHMQFESLSHFASMIQEQMSTRNLKTALNKVKEKAFVFPDTFYDMPRAFFGIFVGLFVASFYCCGCCLVRRPASSLLCGGTKGRMQYYHNGRVVYEWDQTQKVATIYLQPPEGVKQDDLEIKISSRQLRVGRKGKPSFLREDTYDLVNKERSSWTLRSNGELQIFLRKAEKATWPAVLQHKDKASESVVSGFPSVVSKMKLPL